MSDANSEKSAESVELIPQGGLQRSLSDPAKAGLAHHIVQLEACGPLDVYVQGDFEKRKSGNVFLTIHDVGTSFQAMVDFVNHEDMAAQLKDRCVFLHVSLFGQAHKASNLDQPFPSLQALGMDLVSVLDQMYIKEVVVVGDGAGANIALRFGLNHPTRTAGLVLLNASGGEASVNIMDTLLSSLKSCPEPEEPELNKANVKKYADAFQARNSVMEQINSRINFDVLLMAGSKFALVEDSQEIYSLVNPGKASLIRVENVINPLKESKEKLADAIILFCQGLGWIPSVLRKVSRTEQPRLTRRISMEQYDTPNIRRLSLVSK